MPAYRILPNGQVEIVSEDGAKGKSRYRKNERIAKTCGIMLPLIFSLFGHAIHLIGYLETGKILFVDSLCASTVRAMIFSIPFGIAVTVLVILGAWLLADIHDLIYCWTYICISCVAFVVCPILFSYVHLIPAILVCVSAGKVESQFFHVCVAISAFAMGQLIQLDRYLGEGTANLFPLLKNDLADENLEMWMWVNAIVALVGLVFYAIVLYKSADGIEEERATASLIFLIFGFMITSILSSIILLVFGVISLIVGEVSYDDESRAFIALVGAILAFVSSLINLLIHVF